MLFTMDTSDRGRLNLKKAHNYFSLFLTVWHCVFVISRVSLACNISPLKAARHKAIVGVIISLAKADSARSPEARTTSHVVPMQHRRVEYQMPLFERVRR